MLLDKELTPQARLAYAVLLAQATADSEHTWDELAALVGVTSERLEGLAEELATRSTSLSTARASAAL